MQKLFLAIGSVLGALTVMLGAFGAHALQDLLEKNGRLDTFDTAVKYQFFHVLALFVVGILMTFITNRWLWYSGWSFISGILLFSGSLYLLSATNWTKLGIIAPFGGILLIAGWLFLLIGILKSSY